MKHLKAFENINNIEQQPFYLSNGGILYLSDELAHKIAPSDEELKNTHGNYSDYQIKKKNSFFNEERNEKGIRVSPRLDLLKFVRYNGQYRMNIVLLSRQEYLIKDSGKFKYYIGGNSGDFEMHGKNMKRATKECNLKFIILCYPIVKYVSNFYKKISNGELFFDIIREAVYKNPEIAINGIPKELYDELGHYEVANKYNL